jgi:tRNA pseudouridine13 synthase
VTTQTISFLFPQDRDLEQAVAAVDIEGIEILGAARHEHKLRTGHLRGNRFRITLRELETGADDRIRAHLDELAADGIPNAFGPQRFGRDGTNPERALAWLSGKVRGPRNRSMQRLLFSSVQSLLFNQVLDRRVASGTWKRILAGDLAKKHDSGGLFLVPSTPDELAEANGRAAAGQISPTGPIFGSKMRWPEADVAEIEREILANSSLDESLFKAFKRLGKGTRRALRMMLDQVSCDPGSERGFLTVSFVLPKGGYATTVLSELCQITDLARSPSPSPST